MRKTWRAEYLEITRGQLAAAEDRLARGDYVVDERDDLAQLIGATTEAQREGLCRQIEQLRAGIKRAESSTDEEFGESWQ